MIGEVLMIKSLIIFVLFSITGFSRDYYLATETKNFKEYLSLSYHKLKNYQPLTKVLENDESEKLQFFQYLSKCYVVILKEDLLKKKKISCKKTPSNLLLRDFPSFKQVPIETFLATIRPYEEKEVLYETSFDKFKHTFFSFQLDLDNYSQEYIVQHYPKEKYNIEIGQNLQTSHKPQQFSFVKKIAIKEEESITEFKNQVKINQHDLIFSNGHDQFKIYLSPSKLQFLSSLDFNQDVIDYLDSEANNKLLSTHLGPFCFHHQAFGNRLYDCNQIIKKGPSVASLKKFKTINIRHEAGEIKSISFD